jgi:molybdopterin-containing oxidoreductase family iron-sulfur binding subunit
MNDETASLLGIREGEVLKVSSETASIKIPVRLTSKIYKNTVSIETGQGHTAMGETANNRGVNVFSLLEPDHDGPLSQVTIEKTGEMEKPVYLNGTIEQHDRELLKYILLNRSEGKEKSPEKITMPLPAGYLKERDLYRPHEHKLHRWGMAIDLQKCIGCKACEAACYAENNVPVVGREHCADGLEMSWLKVPAYRIEYDRLAFIPLPCQHCDAAPCEPVCPVFASAHTDEGLNAQIYNRCIGTRYCSNNCPYKVRRFNWKNIHYEYPETLRLNPEVTVRSRGVMEKCTFCVQRIRNAEYSAKKEKRKLKEGDIVPACAQTCPTNAIVFGDLLDENSLVSKLFNHERRYQLLHELNTKPAVIYLKKIIL